ncbi:ATP-binding cassette domain-containing protein [Reichenbachiella sp. MSK19-1]|uniref:ATP-binding cassette domain-containing protein n=1 Tax=Reichenbachiella sp. MSK19-1 TaxID=1897631 RepID=UPI000E6C9CF3|nr:ATP-binding cassette domain-containing protein [Reichenbachiella sp. MSK19-1]RJE75342.1 hypothetical protein BGP76_19835 [Reichenbachiella sp. MSK19-1]
MSKTKHWNILVPNGAGKEELIKKLSSQSVILPDVNGKETVLYSAIALAKYIREEEVHDIYEVTNDRGQTLKSMSSGERKRALLAHILKSKPKAIVLDNPLDSLDIAGREALMVQIEVQSDTVSMINVVSRRRDFLTFADESLCYENGQLIPLVANTEGSVEVNFDQEIPAPISPVVLNEEVLIYMKDVKVSYGDRCILKHISWEIKRGEFWQLKGPNGAGKTTLLTMITGDNPKAFGQDIRLFGYQKGSGESVWDIKRNIGYYTSTMTYEFWRNQSIEYMIISGYYDSVGLYDRPTELQRKRTEAWLDLIGLKEKKDKPFVDLPIGWRRLVLIVRAMVKHPPLLILDEPTSDLDDANTGLMTALINKIAKESNTAILYVSHQDELGLTPDKVYHLLPSETGSVGSEEA